MTDLDAALSRMGAALHRRRAREFAGARLPYREDTMSNIEAFPITSIGGAAAAVLSNIDIPAKAEPLDPGVYFGLDEDRYHADAALGSGSMKRLSYSPCDYWFESVHNPLREQDDADKPAFVYGRAIHVCILEGVQKFRRLYAPTDYPGNIKAGKVEREAIDARGMIPLKRDDWDRIQQAATIIRSNPALSEAFGGGVSEVSIFWNDCGIRKKCRIDHLKIRSSVDLKSIRNSRDINFLTACRRAVAERRYDMQAEHYNQGRAALRKLVAVGAVYGDHDAEWLQRVAAASSWAFTFVFYQAKGAPLTHGLTLSPGNGLLDIGRNSLIKADANFKEFSERFGFDTPWVLSEPVEEIDFNDLPQWAFRD